MDKPDVAAEASRVRASIKQAVGKLTGDLAVERQGFKKTSQKASRKAGTTKAKAEKVHKE